MKEDLTPEEVNGHAIDIVTGGVDTVRYLEFWKPGWQKNQLILLPGNLQQ